MNQKTILTILAIAIFSGISFFAGIKFQQRRGFSAINRFSQNFDNRQLRGQGQGTGRNQNQNGDFRGNGMLVGEIISRADNSLTIKTPNNGDKIVIIPQSASVTKSSSASAEELVVGKTVGVFGTSNSDGSLTAATIELDPRTGQRPNLPTPSPSN